MVSARAWGCLAALVWGLFAVGCGKHAAPEATVTLAAAASLRNVVPALVEAYATSHPGTHIVATYGSSGDLRRQVEAGAPIDGVLFASAEPVDRLIAEGRAEAASRRVVAHNRLVLVGPVGGPRVTFATLGALPAGDKVAIGDPGAVPAGQYARDYLRKLGAWDALQGRLVLGGDVGAVLAYARRGEVSAAIVYRTDARGIGDVVVLDEATGEAAPRPEVVVAVVSAGHAAAQAREFLAFTGSPEGQRIFADLGFDPP